MSEQDLDFVRACARRTNELHREASKDYIRTLLVFVCLGAILVAFTLAGIAIGWKPGIVIEHSQEVQP